MGARSQAVLLAAAVSVWSGAIVERTLHAQQAAAVTGTFYCPMHPDITARAEGRCSRCGMALVPGDPLDAREYLVDVQAAPQAVGSLDLAHAVPPSQVGRSG